MVTTPPAGTTDQSKSAKATLQATLASFGLGSLAGWAWQKYTHGEVFDQIMLDLRQTPQYKSRFPAMAELAKQGRGITETQYVNYEQSASNLMHQYGMPAGFYDTPADFTQFLTGNVSISELDTRLQLGAKAALSDPATVSRLTREYGVTPGHIMAFYIDPKRAQPLIERDFVAAQIGGASDYAGFNASKDQADRLAALGITPDAARSGFAALAGSKDLFGALPGTSEQAIGSDAQIAAQFTGDAAARQAIERRQGGRLADQNAAGGFLSGQAGWAGIGAQTGA